MSTSIMSGDVMNDLLVGNDFSTYWDPVSKYQLLQTGNVGSVLGTSIITDGFREPNLRVLEDGELFFTSSPDFTGVYTDRGPIQSVPVDSYPDGSPSRGWSMAEFISAALANAKSVAIGMRQ